MYIASHLPSPEGWTAELAWEGHSLSPVPRLTMRIPFLVSTPGPVAKICRPQTRSLRIKIILCFVRLSVIIGIQNIQRGVRSALWLLSLHIRLVMEDIRRHYMGRRLIWRRRCATNDSPDTPRDQHGSEALHGDDRGYDRGPAASGRLQPLQPGPGRCCVESASRRRF